MNLRHSALLLSLLLIGLSACGNNKDSDTASTPDQTGTTVAEATPAASASAAAHSETALASNADNSGSTHDSNPSPDDNGHREWYGFEEGIALSASTGKHVVIDFYTDWCKWCKVMDKETFSVPEVQAYLFEHFVPIRINAESDETVTYRGQTYSYRELTSAFGVTGFPSLAYLTPNDELIDIIPGYVEKEPFMDIISYIAQECYMKNVDFQQFQETGECL